MLAPEILRFVPYESYELPLYSCAVSAGFPSPADDHIDQQLDLNTYIVENPASTFFVRASGDCMEPAGIFDGDILVVDRSLKFRNNRIIIAAVDGELTVKRISQYQDQTWLRPDNADYPSIKLTEFTEVDFWGVVTFVLHRPK